MPLPRSFAREAAKLLKVLHGRIHQLLEDLVIEVEILRQVITGPFGLDATYLIQLDTTAVRYLESRASWARLTWRSSGRPAGSARTMGSGPCSSPNAHTLDLPMLAARHSGTK